MLHSQRPAHGFENLAVSPSPPSPTLAMRLRSSNIYYPTWKLRHQLHLPKLGTTGFCLFHVFCLPLFFDSLHSPSAVPDSEVHDQAKRVSQNIRWAINLKFKLNGNLKWKMLKTIKKQVNFNNMYCL